MLKILLTSIFIALVLTCSVVYAAQDEESQTSDTILVVPSTCSFEGSSSDSSMTLEYGTTLEPAFDAGYVDLDPDKPTLKIRANKGWRLAARSSGFTGPYAKPVTDLLLKDAAAEHVTNGFNDFKALTLVDQEIAAHASGIKKESHPCQYRILLDLDNDIPGTYEAIVSFTLSTSGT